MRIRSFVSSRAASCAALAPALSAQAAENGEVQGQKAGKRPSVAKARVDFARVTARLKPCPFKASSFPAAYVAAVVAAACAVGVVAAGLAGCRVLPASKPEAMWTMEEARGAQVFHLKCARCHYPTTRRPLNGPGLQALTKVKSMPSGAPPTDERLTQVIVHGRLMMPGTQLNDDQLHDLLAYLHTL